MWEFWARRLDPRFADAAKIRSPLRSVRTRLYFTSESHIHALLNVLRYGSPDLPPLITMPDKLNAIPELNYLSTIVFHVYERVAMPPYDPRRFRVSLALSPGVEADPFDVMNGTATSSVTLIELNDNLVLTDLERFLQGALDAGAGRRRVRVCVHIGGVDRRSWAPVVAWWGAPHAYRNIIWR